MRVDYERAVLAFENLASSQKAPSLHPYYIITDACRDKEVEPVFLTYQEGNKIFYHGFHLSTVKGTKFFDIQSPYGYGGPIFCNADSEFLLRAWSNYLLWCKEHKVLVEFIRFHPLLENWNCYQGQVMEERQTVWIDLDGSDLLSTYSTRARTTIRKAKKSGLAVEWCTKDQFIKIFPNLYNQTMQNLNADSFYYFSDEYFERILNWPLAHLGICKIEDEVVAGAIFLAGSQIMEYHLSAANSLGKRLGATNLLIHEAAIQAKSLGCKALHLGGGTDNTPNNPLLFFKSSFSKLQAQFKIGKYVHQVDEYEKLRMGWEEEHRRKANRVLFYQF